MLPCTEETCIHIVYNQDATRVCSLSGLCFGQKLCDRIAHSNCSGGMSSVGTVNTAESLFIQDTKRDQQIGNKVLCDSQIADWVAIFCSLLVIVSCISIYIGRLTEE